MDQISKARYLRSRTEFYSQYEYNNEYNIHNNKEFDESKGLWRYMDFSKFVNMLDTSSIFFTKPSKFRDPYEGAFSEEDFIRLIGDPYYHEQSDYNQQRGDLISQAQQLLELVGISCWHLNNYESAAMWDLYLRSGEGVAIKSNVKNLVNSIEGEITYGEVQYIDFIKDMASNNTYETLFYKRSSFQHENEFRLMHFEDEERPYFQDYGATIGCDLDLLIDEIYVAPTAPQWFVQTVDSIVKKYELHKTVRQSSLYSKQSRIF